MGIELTRILEDRVIELKAKLEVMHPDSPMRRLTRKTLVENLKILNIVNPKSRIYREFGWLLQ